MTPLNSINLPATAAEASADTKPAGRGPGLSPGEYPPGQVFIAQDLYCVDRLTFEGVSARTGVSVATLKRWSEKYNWRAKREELAQAESRIRSSTYLARLKMLEMVIQGGGAFDAFAVAKLESLALDQARFKREEAALGPPEAVKIESPIHAAALLEEALGAKLGGLLAEPSRLDLKTIRDLRAALALVAEMRGRADSDGEGAAGLTPETEAKIKQLLAEGL